MRSPPARSSGASHRSMSVALASPSARSGVIGIPRRHSTSRIVGRRQAAPRWRRSSAGAAASRSASRANGRCTDGSAAAWTGTLCRRRAVLRTVRLPSVTNVRARRRRQLRQEHVLPDGRTPAGRVRETRRGQPARSAVLREQAVRRGGAGRARLLEAPCGLLDVRAGDPVARLPRPYESRGH